MTQLSQDLAHYAQRLAAEKPKTDEGKFLQQQCLRMIRDLHERHCPQPSEDVMNERVKEYIEYLRADKATRYSCPTNASIQGERLRIAHELEQALAAPAEGEGAVLWVNQDSFRWLKKQGGLGHIRAFSRPFDSGEHVPLYLRPQASEVPPTNLDRSLVQTLLDMANEGGVCPTPPTVMVELAQAWLMVHHDLNEDRGAEATP